MRGTPEERAREEVVQDKRWVSHGFDCSLQNMFENERSMTHVHLGVEVGLGLGGPLAGVASRRSATSSTPSSRLGSSSSSSSTSILTETARISNANEAAVSDTSCRTFYNPGPCRAHAVMGTATVAYTGAGARTATGWTREASEVVATGAE